MIAATARARAMTLATRNVDDFAETDIKRLDPWRQ
jgi:predicted nucleic acid-binding protein